MYSDRDKDWPIFTNEIQSNSVKTYPSQFTVSVEMTQN